MFHKPSEETREQKMKRLQDINNEIKKTLQEAKILYDLKDSEAAVRLVNILDDLLKNKEWEATLLLRTAKKRLLNLREEAQQIVNDLNVISTPKEPSQVIAPIKEGYIKVYIALYQTQGSNLKIWHDMLKSLAKYSITRPVYDNEEYVRELIRSKPDVQRHGYAVVAVKENGIIESGKVHLDQFNHKLLTLQERAVTLENIIEFVHANEKRYIIRGDTLILLQG